ncbi:hypothetical protein Esti_005290 [Eimeria stiedai]
MKAFQLLLFAGVSLPSLKNGRAEEAKPAEPVPSPVTHTGRRVNCRQEMNALRAEVGLPDFSEPDEVDKLPVVEPSSGSQPELRDETIGSSGRGGDGPEGPHADTYGTKAPEAFVISVCDALMEEKSSLKESQVKGTYMYAPQKSAKEDCAAAVEYWKGAIKSFSTLPPAYSESQGAYDDYKRISLVGLFNTRHNPTVDCAFITCHPDATGEEAGDEDVDVEGRTEDATVSASPLSPSVAAHTSDQVGEKMSLAPGPGRRLSADDAPTYGLVCISKPQTLLGTQLPFTEELWGKIACAGNSYVQPKVLAVFAFAAAALVRSLF